MPKVTLLNRSGQPMLVDAEDVEFFKQRGFRDPSLTEEATQGIAEQREEDFGGTAETVRAFGEGALRGVSFGLSDLALRGLGADREGLAARQDVNPIASTVGEIGGAIGSTLLGGGLAAGAKLGAAGRGVARFTPGGLAGQLAERTGAAAARRTGGSTLARFGADAATEGALFGAGSAFSDVALHDEKITAEALLPKIGLGAVTGGLIGGGFGVAGGAAFKGGQKLLQKIRARKSAKLVDMSSEEGKALAADFGGAVRATDDEVRNLLVRSYDVEANFGDDLVSVVAAPKAQAGQVGPPTAVGHKRAQEGTSLDKAVRQQFVVERHVNQIAARNHHRVLDEVFNDVHGMAGVIGARGIAGKVSKARRARDAMLKAAEAVKKTPGAASTKQLEGAISDYRKAIGEYAEAIGQPELATRADDLLADQQLVVSQRPRAAPGKKGVSNKVDTQADVDTIVPGRKQTKHGAETTDDVESLDRAKLTPAVKAAREELLVSLKEWRKAVGIESKGPRVSIMNSVDDNAIQKFLAQSDFNQVIASARSFGKYNKAADALTDAIGDATSKGRLAEAGNVLTEKLHSIVDSRLGKGAAAKMDIIDLMAAMGLAGDLADGDITPGSAPEALIKLWLGARLVKGASKSGLLKNLLNRFSVGAGAVVGRQVARGANPIVGGGVASIGAALGRRADPGRIFDSAAEPGLTGLQAVDGMKARVGRAVSSLVEKGAKPVIRASVPTAIKVLNSNRLDGDNKPFKDARDAIKSYQEVLDRAGSDPAGTHQRIVNNVSAVFGPGTFKSAFADQALKTMLFLQGKVPRDPGDIQRIGRSRWRPSPTEVKKFANYLEATDFDTVLSRMKNGTMTRQHAEAMQALFPETFDFFRETLLANIEEIQEKAGYGQRVMLSILFQAELDSTMRPAFIQRMQQSFADDAEQSAPDQTQNWNPSALQGNKTSEQRPTPGQQLGDLQLD